MGVVFVTVNEYLENEFTDLELMTLYKEFKLMEDSEANMSENIHQVVKSINKGIKDGELIAGGFTGRFYPHNLLYSIRCIFADKYFNMLKY